MSENIDKDWLASLQPEQTWLAVLPYRNQPGYGLVSPMNSCLMMVPSPMVAPMILA